VRPQKGGRGADDFESDLFERARDESSPASRENVGAMEGTVIRRLARRRAVALMDFVKEVEAEAIERPRGEVDPGPPEPAHEVVVFVAPPHEALIEPIDPLEIGSVYGAVRRHQLRPRFEPEEPVEDVLGPQTEEPPPFAPPGRGTQVLQARSHPKDPLRLRFREENARPRVSPAGQAPEGMASERIGIEDAVAVEKNEDFAPRLSDGQVSSGGEAKSVVVLARVRHRKGGAGRKPFDGCGGRWARTVVGDHDFDVADGDSRVPDSIQAKGERLGSIERGDDHANTRRNGRAGSHGARRATLKR